MIQTAQLFPCSLAASSEIVIWIGLLVAEALSIVVVRHIFDWLVADVAEQSLTVFTCQHVLFVSLHVNLATVGTGYTKLDVDVWVLLLAHVLPNKIKCHFQRLQVTIEYLVTWILLEVLLTLCRVDTYPTE